MPLALARRLLSCAVRSSWYGAFVLDLGKRSLLGVAISAIDYDAATTHLVDAAQNRHAFAASALAVHGVMTAARDLGYRDEFNRLDFAAPDGQPVRWALNLLHGTALPDRVYGPALMGRVLASLAEKGLPIYLYGSRSIVLNTLIPKLQERYPGLVIAGSEPGQYRTARPDELRGIATRITRSGARFVFVGLGCPRQEIFAANLRPLLNVPLLGVGAAFDYHAGLLRRPPVLFQRAGLEWLWRLTLEPRRLWRRYVLLNPAYVALVTLQSLGLWRPAAKHSRPSTKPTVEV